MPMAMERISRMGEGFLEFDLRNGASTSGLSLLASDFWHADGEGLKDGLSAFAVDSDRFVVGFAGGAPHRDRIRKFHCNGEIFVGRLWAHHCTTACQYEGFIVNW